MATAFHYQDTPPQLFLDELHKIDIPKLYDTSITSQQRTNLIVLIKKRLTEWRKNLRQQIKTIQQRDVSDMDEPYEVPLATAPYQKLDELATELSKAVTELERELKAGRALPKGFGFGTEIYGWYETGEWHIGYPDEVEQFETLIYVKNRLDNTKEEMIPMRREIKLAQARVKQQKGDLKALMKRYKARKSYIRLLIGILVVLAIAGGSLIGGWFIFTSPTPYIRGDMELNQVVGGSLFVVGTVALLMIIVLFRRRSRALEKLKGEIRNGKQDLKIFMEEGRELRLAYYPSEQLAKELTRKYRVLRKIYPES